MNKINLTRQEILWLMENCAQDLEPYKPDMHGELTKNPDTGATMATGALTITGEPDHEVSMATSDLEKVASYSQSLAAKMSNMGEINLPAWVQAKITKASDYISSVHHYLDKYLVQDDQMVSEQIEGKIETASHEIEIDVSISKSDMKKLHDGKKVVLTDSSGKNSFKVTIKAD